MNYYDKLNLAIKNSLNDTLFQHQLYYFGEIVKLANIVIENTPEICIKDYSLVVPLNTSIQIAISFFNTINPNYSNMFQNILWEKNTYDNKEYYSVKFHKVKHPRESMSEVRADGYVHLSYSDTLDDVFSICHEITHRFSAPKNQTSIIKQFLGETSTICIEFLLQDYLIDNEEYCSDEILKRKNNRLMFYTYDDAGSMIFEHILLQLYKKNNNYITEDILLKYLDSIDKNTNLYKLMIHRGMRYLNEIVVSGHLNFPQRQRYVIGALLASDFHNKIKSDPQKISQLCDLIDILGHTDLSTEDDLKKLSTLDIPIVKNGKLSINESDIIRLSSCYKNEVLDVMSYQNKNDYTI